MNFNTFKDRMLIISIVLIVSVLLLLLDSIGAIGALYDITALATVPLRVELHDRAIKVNDFLGIIGKISLLQEENDKLKKENTKLFEEIATLKELRIENTNLKKQLGIPEKIEGEITQARVIGNAIALNNSIQINVGESNDVSQGDVVVFGKYAIGIVQRVESYNSRISLVTSPTSNIPVRGQKNRALGLIAGEVGNTMRMSNILPGEIVEEGEIILTSGVESEFPSGLIIGKVTSITKNPANATQEAEVEIQIDLSRLDYVYVIRGQS